MGDSGVDVLRDPLDHFTQDSSGQRWHDASPKDVVYHEEQMLASDFALLVVQHRVLFESENDDEIASQGRTMNVDLSTCVRRFRMTEKRISRYQSKVGFMRFDFGLGLALGSFQLLVEIDEGAVEVTSIADADEQS